MSEKAESVGLRLAPWTLAVILIELFGRVEYSELD